MAFSFKEESNRNFLTAGAVGLFIVVLAVGTYLLFFSKAPLIEVVTPPEVGSVSKLSKVDFGAGDFAQSEVFSSLKLHVPEAEAGPAGRENPFSPF